MMAQRLINDPSMSVPLAAPSARAAREANAEKREGAKA